MNEQTQPTTPIKIIRRKEVEVRTGLGRTSIYDGVAQGTFPAPIHLYGSRAVGWIEEEVDAWVNSCIARRSQNNAPQKSQGQ